MEKWLNIVFETSSGLTEEFSKFNREVKNHIKKITKNDFNLVSWNRGHFYFSAFLENKENKKIVYVSCSDVRFFRNEWYENLLVRTAENIKDYSGGGNNSSKLEDLNEQALSLTK